MDNTGVDRADEGRFPETVEFNDSNRITARVYTK